MRFIPTKIHGIIDYIWGVFFSLSPWIFNYSFNRTATLVAVVFGVGAIVYSVFTDYEGGLVRKISINTHLTFDLISGIVLMLSPFILNFREEIYLPHLLFGGFSVIASLTTQKQVTNRVDFNTGRAIGK
jgi:hypothetical protein